MVKVRAAREGTNEDDEEEEDDDEEDDDEETARGVDEETARGVKEEGVANGFWKDEGGTNGVVARRVVEEDFLKRLQRAE